MDKRIERGNGSEKKPKGIGLNWMGVRDGGDEGGRGRERMRETGLCQAWSYNCQTLTEEKIRIMSEEIANEWQDTYMGVQGTKRKATEFGSEQTETSTKWHDIIEMRVPWNAKGEQTHAGLAFFMPKGAKRYIRSIMVPTK